jgi:hypothetical protein
MDAIGDILRQGLDEKRDEEEEADRQLVDKCRESSKILYFGDTQVFRSRDGESMTPFTGMMCPSTAILADSELCPSYSRSSVVMGHP